MEDKNQALYTLLKEYGLIPIEDSARVDSTRGFPIPHQETFLAKFNHLNRTYHHQFDEATRDSQYNKRAMRRDPLIMDSLRTRQRPCSLLSWSVAPNNPHNTEERLAAKECEMVIKAIPFFHKIRMWLLESLWYGKSAVQLSYGWITIDGRKYYAPLNHRPINGDKLVLSWSGEIAILTTRYAIRGNQIISTTLGPAYRISPHEREQLIVASFEPEDRDYSEGEMAGAVGGVGLRSHLYWFWWLKYKALGWLQDFLEMFGVGGYNIAYYEHGNADSLEEVKAAVESRTVNSYMLFPRYKDGSTGGPGIEPTRVIDSASARVLVELISGYYDVLMRRLILGQNLTAEAKGMTLGSGPADLDAQTLGTIIKYDAEGMAEHITHDLVKVLYKYNWPNVTPGKFLFEVDTPNAADVVDYAYKIWEMGGTIDEDELHKVSGLGRVEPGHTALNKLASLSPAGIADTPPVPTAGDGGPTLMTKIDSFLERLNMALGDKPSKILESPTAEERKVIDALHSGNPQAVHSVLSQAGENKSYLLNVAHSVQRHLTDARRDAPLKAASDRYTNAQIGTLLDRITGRNKNIRGEIDSILKEEKKRMMQSGVSEINVDKELGELKTRLTHGHLLGKVMGILDHSKEREYKAEKYYSEDMTEAREAMRHLVQSGNLKEHLNLSGDNNLTADDVLVSTLLGITSPMSNPKRNFEAAWNMLEQAGQERSNYLAKGGDPNKSIWEFLDARNKSQTYELSDYVKEFTQDERKGKKSRLWSMLEEAGGKPITREEAKRLVKDLDEPKLNSLLDQMKSKYVTKTVAEGNSPEEAELGWTAQRQKKFHPSGTIEGDINTLRGLLQGDVIPGVKGVDKAVEFLSSKQKAEELLKKNPQLKLDTEEFRYGSHLFGPKRGSFIQNLLPGGGDELTIDRWTTRFWNMLTDEVIETKGGKSGVKDAPTNEQRISMRSAFKAIADETGMEVRDIQALIWEYTQDIFRSLGGDIKSYSFKDAAIGKLKDLGLHEGFINEKRSKAAEKGKKKR